MHLYRKQPLDTILLPIAGPFIRTRSKMQNGTQTHFVDVKITATFTIAAFVAAAIVNRGSLFAAVAEIGISESGAERFLADGASMRQLAEYGVGSPLSSTRLASTAIAATVLTEHFRIYFAFPHAQDPAETAFMEKDIRSNLELFIKLHSNAAAQIATAGGGGTATLGNVTVTLIQGHNQASGTRPLFIPSIRQIVQAVPAANPQLPIDLRVSNFLRGILIKTQAQNANGATIEVPNLITSFNLTGDARPIIGPEMVPWDDMVRDMESEFSGNVGPGATQSGGAYVYLNFQTNGKLSQILAPYQDANLKLKVAAVPTGGGNTNDAIVITLVELEHDQGKLDNNGVPLVSEVPFPV